MSDIVEKTLFQRVDEVYSFGPRMMSQVQFWQTLEVFETNMALLKQLADTDDKLLFTETLQKCKESNKRLQSMQTGCYDMSVSAFHEDAGDN
jgi:hypothetical protein